MLGDMPLDVEKIEQLREKRGWSQAHAATAAGLGGGRQQWNNIVNGNQGGITLATLEKIAAALGVSAKALLKD